MTAQEFLKSKEPNTWLIPEQFLIEFAQMHVEACKKEIAAKIESGDFKHLAWYEWYRDILIPESYNKENIQ
jgi:hypothetical protein